MHNIHKMFLSCQLERKQDAAINLKFKMQLKAMISKLNKWIIE